MSRIFYLFEYSCGKKFYSGPSWKFEEKMSHIFYEIVRSATFYLHYEPELYMYMERHVSIQIFYPVSLLYNPGLSPLPLSSFFTLSFFSSSLYLILIFHRRDEGLKKHYCT
jgi:hypothetical protein